MVNAVANSAREAEPVSSEGKDPEGPRSVSVAKEPCIPEDRATEPAQRVLEPFEPHPDTIPAPAWFDEEAE